MEKSEPVTPIMFGALFIYSELIRFSVFDY